MGTISYETSGDGTMPLAIPAAHYKALTKWLELTASNRKALHEALKHQQPALYLRLLSERLATGGLKIPRQDLNSMMLVLGNLYTAFKQSNLPKDRFLKDFKRTVSDIDAISVKLDDNEWSAILADLNEILDFDSIGITSKALRVMTSHAQIFQEARVLTDIRPVFQSDPEKPPKAIVIIHNLKVDFLADGRNKTFYVALDSNDLDILENAVKRAKLKEKGLLTALGSTSMQILSTKNAN